MNDQTCESCKNSEHLFKGKKTCKNHIYQFFSPILDDLLSCFVKDPYQINSKVRQQELNELKTEIMLLPSCIDSVLNSKNKEIDKNTVGMHSFIVKFCQFYLLGIETRFGICRTCNFVEIDYIILKLCGCDTQLANDLIELNNNFNKREENKVALKAAEKKPPVVKEPFAIWDKLESMVRKYTNKKSSTILEITAYYNTAIHKDMWEYYDDLTELILSEPESKNGSVIKNFKYDGSNVCYFVLADIKTSHNDSVELKTPHSLISLYQILFKP